MQTNGDCGNRCLRKCNSCTRVEENVSHDERLWLCILCAICLRGTEYDVNHHNNIEYVDHINLSEYIEHVDSDDDDDIHDKHVHDDYVDNSGVGLQVDRVLGSRKLWATG